MGDLKKTSSSGKCPQCGAELPRNLPPELCPKCLLKTGMATQPVVGPEGTVFLPNQPAHSRALPQPGEQLGHYRIVRTLGQGGMGAVFEAEDLDSGRRVALKVLSHRLDAPDARERFFREGRLAASITHPNSVYVFGTEVIGGTPVISMELVAGGTLQDRVASRGPLPVGEAVDAVLQIVAGLEAAQRIGILHRDVKPSNCFRDLDGTVKVGDFGLSISTAVRTEPALTAPGSFLGTPAFCSPEQLRGDELNVRSDMYSVGATLFYLLTGRTPFEGKSSVQLLATVLEQHAPSPRKFRPEIPRGLASVVTRCLAKQPGDRFKHYAELVEALTPYSSAAPTPATLGLRFVAGAVDQLLIGVMSLAVMAIITGDVMATLNARAHRGGNMWVWMLIGLVGGVSYFTILEATLGASFGKVLCRLRVVGPDSGAPCVWRALVRALMYVVLPALPFWILFQGNPQGFLHQPPAIQYLLNAMWFVVLLILFSSARRRNGFAALQDLVTKTRVIARNALQARPELDLGELPQTTDTRQTVGPYHILQTLEQTADTHWLLGFDTRLLRKVWMRVVAPGTPPVPAAWRSIGRIGRLRWLTGRRSAEDNWDAFEAASGRPLLSLIQFAQPWRQVRFWLFDLANELSLAEKDGTLPPVLALDRVWITADGRAKLLDFPAPGIVAPKGSTAPAQSTKDFLKEFAAVALAGQAGVAEQPPQDTQVRLPLHACRFLSNLPALADARAIASALQPLLNKVAEVSRLRRGAIVAGCLALPVVATGGMLFGVAMMERWNARNPGLLDLNNLLYVHDRATSRWAQNHPHPTDRQFSIYIAHNYRSAITNEERWTDLFALSIINGEHRRFAEQSVKEFPSPTEQEVAEAEAAITKFCPKTDAIAQMKQPWMAPMVFGSTLAMYVGLPALLAALLFRGGLILLASGVTFVRRDGVQASRLRSFWRGLVAWSPLAAAPVIFGLLKVALDGLAAGTIAGLIVCVLATVSLALPDRGLPDRLAGTWPVPR